MYEFHSGTLSLRWRWQFNLIFFRFTKLTYIQIKSTLQWRYNRRDCISDHQPNDCLINRLFRRRSKEAPKLRVTGLCKGNSPVTGELPATRASDAENVSIWWCHKEKVPRYKDALLFPASSMIYNTRSHLNHSTGFSRRAWRCIEYLKATAEGKLEKRDVFIGFPSYTVYWHK